VAAGATYQLGTGWGAWPNRDARMTAPQEMTKRKGKLVRRCRQFGPDCAQAARKGRGIKRQTEAADQTKKVEFQESEKQALVRLFDDPQVKKKILALLRDELRP